MTLEAALKQKTEAEREAKRTDAIRDETSHASYSSARALETVLKSVAGIMVYISKQHDTDTVCLGKLADYFDE
ncbi:hypothetical protein SLS59_003620 [Nothophoma quercina]|uniref:Uncharacterized protein n=1 Tax=Nothophoma quercina TaxID=749835 RepID=A0ABR3RJG1_9PLEO